MARKPIVEDVEIDYRVGRYSVKSLWRSFLALAVIADVILSLVVVALVASRQPPYPHTNVDIAGLPSKLMMGCTYEAGIRKSGDATTETVPIASDNLDAIVKAKRIGPASTAILSVTPDYPGRAYVSVLVAPDPLSVKFSGFAIWTGSVEPRGHTQCPSRRL